MPNGIGYVAFIPSVRWFTVLKEYGWGYALWEFSGPFGIAEHGRPGACYEKMHGSNVDRPLLELYLASRALN